MSSLPEVDDKTRILLSKRQIDEARAAWEKDKALPSYKPVLPTRETLLQSNMNMRYAIAGSTTITTLGHKKHYSSTQISKLSRGV
jgi:hypothetical protein